MAETRRKFDRDFKEGAVRLVRETGRPIAQGAKDLGINEGTLGDWVSAEQRRRGDGNGALGEDERAELARLRKENAEVAMERDGLKRSVALWVKDAMGRERCPGPGPASMKMARCRRRRCGVSSSRLRWGGCSPRMGASTARRGSPRTCAMRAGRSAR